LLFHHKNKAQVDLGDLETEKETLLSFLQTTFKVPVIPVGNWLRVESEEVSPQELQRVITKFIYKHNINNTYYVMLNGNTLRINAFKGLAKKPENPKKSLTHQTAAQSWGL